MSREHFPGAVLALIREAGAPDGHRKTQLIFHSTGTMSSAIRNRNYFDRPDVAVESTLIVDLDGTVVQAMNASDKADANTSASTRAVSVEVVGTADIPFTPQQLASCTEIARWAVAEHDVEPRQVSLSDHTSSGIGWHVMHGAPGPWTTARGKECPGPKRIGQVRDVIIPAVQSGRPPINAVQEDDDLNAAQDESLTECRRMLAVLLGASAPAPTETKTLTQVAQTHENASESRRMAGVLLGALPPVGSERLPEAGDVDVKALAARLSEGLGIEVAARVGAALVAGAKQ